MKFYILTLLVVTPAVFEARKPMNLDVAKNQVKEYYITGKFDKEVKKVAQKAWKKFKKLPVKKNSLIVFDIDDTLISSYEANKKLGFGNLLICDPNWASSADFKAIGPVKELYKKLIDKGFHVAFLSNREHKLLEATKKNLHEQGYTTYEELIIREPESDGKKINSQQFKTQARKKFIDHGYEIVGTIGDQLSDLRGEHIGIAIKIPNYMYQVV